MTALASTAVLVAVPLAADAAVADPTPASVLAGPATFQPTVLSATAPDVANSMRGQFRWMGYASQPAGWPAPDVYYRDQVYWGRLERTKGVYDFSAIESGMALAGAAKGKFGFRVMSYCPGCWMEQRTDKAAWPPITPTYLPIQAGTGGTTGVSPAPDWNNEAFLSRWEALMAALGKRYANDPRLGYVDVGGYGKYGEWWVDRATPRITDANGLRMIKAVTTAFPNKHVLINTMSPVAFTMSALNANPNLGIRTDSLGCPNMYSMVTDPVDTRLREIWKTRPFLAEWGTTGDPVVGADQVARWHVSTTSSHNMRLTYDAMTATQRTAYRQAVATAGFRYSVTRLSVGALRPGQKVSVSLAMKNSGSAPTYDAWNVQLRLTDSSGRVAATLPLSVNLKTLLPGATTYLRTVTAPAGLATGTYTASVAVVDPSGYLAPMALANTSRLSDGSYRLGRVGVAYTGLTGSRRG